jgi:hypothetical protein
MVICTLESGVSRLRGHPDDERTLPHLPFWLFLDPPQKISKNLKKISYEPHRVRRNFSQSQLVKISYANGRVSVRIFYKNNSSPRVN